MIVYRVLTDADFPRLYHATLAAFSGYAVPYQPTQDTLRRMFLINGVDLDDLSKGKTSARLSSRRGDKISEHQR